MSTPEPATAAALEADADATQTSVSAVIRDAVSHGLPLIRARKDTGGDGWAACSR